MNHRYLEVIALGLGLCVAGIAANAQQTTAPTPQFPASMPGAQTASTPVPIPQALGPKAAGKIRIGIAPAVAQMGQGNNAQADFGTPIRNSLVLIMGGPAVEITPLDSHLP